MKKKQYAIPDFVTANDIKRVRGQLGMTQKEFAELIGVSKPTIERWETSKEKISGYIILLLNMLENNMDYLDKIKLPKKEMPLRMFYMYNQNICTLIDVNVIKQEVKIKNYTNNIMFRAFGVNENPTYNDYLDFLKSRCFPETRDKLKLVLKDLNIPFYDPLLIIEKTEGRMAEDDFWIKIED